MDLTIREEDCCKECGRFYTSGEEKRAARARLNPIYGTDFKKPLSEIIEEVRSRLTVDRGMLSDVTFAFPGWRSRVESAQGAITCAIESLYNTMQEMQKVERMQKDH